MRKMILLLSLILTLPLSIIAKTKIQGYAEKGGRIVQVTPTTSYKLLETYPGATVTVYNAGTLTLATIYSDNAGTPKANPFTADSVTGYYGFFADNGDYDIRFSGTGITTPFTPLTYVKAFEPEANPLTSLTDLNYVVDSDGNASGAHNFKVAASTALNIFNDKRFLFTSSAVEMESSTPIWHNGTTRPSLIGHGTGASQSVPTQVNYFLNNTSSPGGQFGFVSQLRAGGVEGTGQTPGAFGNYKVAGSFMLENTPGIETDAILHGQTIVVQHNLGPSIRRSMYGLEINLNQNHSDLNVSSYPASAAVGMQFLSGGLFKVHRGITIASSSGTNQVLGAITVEERGMFDYAFMAGNFTLPYISGGAQGFLLRHYGNDTIWVQRHPTDFTGSILRASTDAGLDFYMLNAEGGSVGAWFRSNQSDGFQVYKNNAFSGSPTNAVAYSNAVPGTALGNGAKISTYATATGWVERLYIPDDGTKVMFNGEGVYTNGFMQIGDAGAKPACAADKRGTIWHEFGGAGVADTIEICGKNAANNYVWVAMGTF